MTPRKELRMRPFAPVLTITALLALAGCGGSSGGGGNGGGYRAAPTTSTETAAPIPAGPVTISMASIAFAPKQTTVKAGQVVTWKNTDPLDHNVTATKGAGFHSKDFGQGGTFRFTPLKAGTISYVCTLHPGMDGTLTVTK